MENQSVVQKIDEAELEILHAVGNGAYGIVYKAQWRLIHVAVKEFKGIDPDTINDEFLTESRQLSSVKHRNIITLYGVCTSSANVSLVMEFAENGSLHGLIHGKHGVYYSAAHAMSWARQCAEGVAYLHARKPLPLIHRDLKPLNLLLFDCCRLLKICDFGTSRFKSTNMTDNKGSAVWMAPEVFKAGHYDEKCDVFSWSIILWEILAREIPFKDLTAAYAILWSTYSGNRPPLLEGCPKPIEDLMTSCWVESLTERPSMDYVVKVMNVLCRYFPGADEPIIIPQNEDSDVQSGANTIKNYFSEEREMVSNYVKTPTNEVEVDQVTIRESAIEEFARRWGPEQTESEKKSDDDLFDTLMSSRSNSFRWKKQCPPPADQINNEFNQLSIDIDPNAWDLPASQVNSMMDAMLVNHTYAKEEEDDEEVENLNVNVTEANELVISTNQIDKSNGNISDDDENLMYLMLEPHLRPVTPEPNNYVSRTIFEEHKKLAKEYLKIQTEIAYVTKHKNELLMGMNEDVRQKRLDYCKKLQEKEALEQLEANLRQQLQNVESTVAPEVHHLTYSQSTPNMPSTSAGLRFDRVETIDVPIENEILTTTTIPNDDDDWILVSSQQPSVSQRRH